MGNPWFETVAVAQRRAKKRLPSSVYEALIAGTETGLTMRDNVVAFGELGFLPRVAGLPDRRETTTTVMGQEIPWPVLLSPTGVQAVHPDGEIAVARAAASRGTAMGLSSFASKPVEEVVAANPKTFFQVYWIGGRERMLPVPERAKSARAAGLIATLDWTFSTGRDWGSPWIPEKMNLRAMARYAPQAIRRPRWLLDYIKTRKLPDLTVPNITVPGEEPITFFGAYAQWMQTPMPTWDDVAWLREQWEGPFMLKGIMRVEDARRAADVGATAISVSNHGGNDLDGAPGTIRVLPGIVEAMGDQVEVLIDGGVRRGADVVRALSLGAKAVMIGRAYLWRLAANGQAGVENVLDILSGGIDATMLGLGRSSIDELSQADLIIPPDFTHGMGPHNM